jgi:hypothetical protein
MFLRLLGAPCLWRATMKTESLLVLVSPIEPHDGWVASTMLETAGLDSLPHDWDWGKWQEAANEKLAELVSEWYKTKYHHVRVLVDEDQHWSPYVAAQGHAYDRIKYVRECANQDGGWRFDLYAESADAGTAAVLESRRSTDGD